MRRRDVKFFRAICGWTADRSSALESPGRAEVGKKNLFEDDPDIDVIVPELMSLRPRTQQLSSFSKDYAIHVAGAK
jgi:hypothetical protein